MVLVKEKMAKQTIKAIWNNIAITIDYVPNYSNSVKELTGETLSHLEVRSVNQRKLPITETGYRSHFTSKKEVDTFGGAEPYVLTWLNQEAQSKEWQDYILSSQQLTLF